MVGRKIVMAVSGLMMALFVVAHLLGNTSIFAGPNGINAYAAKLHELAPVVWAYRLVMIILFVAIALSPTIVLFVSFSLYAASGPILTLLCLRRRKKSPRNNNTEKP